MIEQMISPQSFFSTFMMRRSWPLFVAAFYLMLAYLPRMGLAEDVKKIPAPKSWPGFRIFVWQYKTDAVQDAQLYKQAGFQAFHIDRGAEQEDRVAFAREQQWPYYVDHAAGKGILHLTERTGKDEIPSDGSVSPRPQSLADQEVLAQLKRELAQNVPVTRGGPVVGYALDDEVSIGIFNNPVEVDASLQSIEQYRQWLLQQYGNLESINAQWGTTHTSVTQIVPSGFGDVRNSIRDQPLSKWNLAPWMDWRSFMDTQFAEALSTAVRWTNALDPDVPAGIVGGQQPAPYGGFDYGKLSKSLQWIEAYDIGGTNEILRSLWDGENSRPRTQTFFSSGNAKVDAWFLWYYFLHGNRGVIAWPDRGGKAWFENGQVDPVIQANAATFRELQGPMGDLLFADNPRFEHDGIAVLYSHPSVQAGWAMDALVHGSTWPRRSSGLDNQCQTVGKNREAWFKLLEDCGFQYQVITAEQLAGSSSLGPFKVLVLPHAMAMSDAECESVKRFVEQGGTVIADYWTALLDQHGRGRQRGGLDDLFGIRRDESKGYFDGTLRSEINGELYQRPFLNRLPEQVTRWQQLRLVELGTVSADRNGNADPIAMHMHHVGDGKAVYLNLSPVEYWSNEVRGGAIGGAWRKLISDQLRDGGIVPVVEVVDVATGASTPMTEVVRWRQDGRTILGIVRNPTRQRAIDSMGELGGLDGNEIEVELRFRDAPGELIDLRTGKSWQRDQAPKMRWKPWEGLVFELK